jgi:hypothetical protein
MWGEDFNFDIADSRYDGFDLIRDHVNQNQNIFNFKLIYSTP